MRCCSTRCFERCRRCSSSDRLLDLPPHGSPRASSTQSRPRAGHSTHRPGRIASCRSCCSPRCSGCTSPRVATCGSLVGLPRYGTRSWATPSRCSMPPRHIPGRWPRSPRLSRRRGPCSSTASGQLLGQPPIRYLTEWRLHLAAGLLRTSPASVGEIAVEVGYESEAAFSRAFKRSLGMAPAHWRIADHAGPVAR